MKNTITRTKNTVSATYLPYAAYKSALALATAHEGEIGKTDKGNFKATFNSVETAKKFVAEWTAEYNANRKVDLAPTQKPKASKPTATKGKAETKPTSSTKKTTKKPKASKGNKLDFAKVKGKTKSERNRNAHALILAQGIKSGSAEYMALWNEWTNAR